MNVRIKRLHKNAIIPKYGRKGDAGFDLHATLGCRIKPGQKVTVPTGIAIELPDGYVSHVWDRSGLAAKHGITTLAGVIDSNYRGEYNIVMINLGEEDYEIKAGDRIAQIVVIKHEVVSFTEVEELEDSERADNWSMSSGK
ncbi:MAG: dUTP pyrophosphatase [Candidatus Woesearchaeota archaeon]|jgi:dUTP pyrophosphatase